MGIKDQIKNMTHEQRNEWRAIRLGIIILGILSFCKVLGVLEWIG